MRKLQLRFFPEFINHQILHESLVMWVHVTSLFQILYNKCKLKISSVENYANQL